MTSNKLTVFFVIILSMLGSYASASLYVPAGCKVSYEAADYRKDLGTNMEMDSPSLTITFADPNVKALCVANWDTNDDGELSYDEAAAVVKLGAVFKENTTITSFDELRFFTGLTFIGKTDNIMTMYSDNTFGGCTNLASVIIPNSVTSIGEDAFSDCTRLESITIPNSVTSLGDHAFDGCEGLISITIPNSVTSIGNATFQECTGLTSISIPNSVTSIGLAAYYGCKGLTSVTIPNSVTSIGIQSFGDCGGLISIVVENGNTVYDSRNNCNAIIETSTNTLHTACKNTFIPNSVTSIGHSAFLGCTSLTSIIIPNGITSIGEDAFRFCTSLTSVTIPKSVVSIGDDAFYRCSALSSVFVERETPISIPSSVFYASNYQNATLYVPESCLSAYVTANYWMNCNEIVGFGYIGKVDSDLTGETDISCFRIVQPGTLGGFFVQEGKPRKVKIVGEVDCSDLRALYEYNYYINYIDLSDAHIHAYQSFPDAYLDSSWMGGYDDDYWEGPWTIVLPMTLQEYKGCAYDIYSEQTTPFKTTITSSFNECRFHVPSGTRNGWIENTTYPENVFFIDGPIKDVYVSTAGRLSSLLSNEEIESMNVLTITGNINAKDFSVLKRMGNLLKLQIEATVEAYSGNEGPVVGQTEYQEGEVPAYTFQNNTNLQSVSLPRNTNIGDYAFDGCTSLKELSCYNVTSLGDFCFRNTIINGYVYLRGPNYTNCSNWYSYEDEEIQGVDTGIKEFEHIGLNPFFGVKTSGILKYTNEGDYDVDGDGNADWKEYDLKYFNVLNNSYYENYYSGVTDLSKNVLYAYSSKYSQKLPNTITTLADYAISGSELTSIDLNAVTTIGDGFLYKCPLLKSILCDNTSYKSKDGVLYTNDMKTLVKYPCAKSAEELTIPSTVEQISKWAFEGTQSLTSIIVEATTPPALADFAFEDFDVTNITLYVPAGSKAAYEGAEYWREFDSIKEYPDGDVNQDGEVDMVDVVDIARYVIGTPSESFIVFLADINGDKSVNVADAVVLVNEITGNQYFARSMKAPQHGATTDVLSLTENDDHSLSLVIDTQQSYTAFQFDLMLPDGVEVTQMNLVSPNNQKHQLLYNKVDNGHYSVVALSTSNRVLDVNNGEILSIMVNGLPANDVGIENIHFVTTRGIDVALGALSMSKNGIATSIENHDVTPSSVVNTPVYNLNGQRLNGLQKGLNIVNRKKVVIK